MRDDATVSLSGDETVSSRRSLTRSTGKTLYPVTTHAVSGLSGVPAVYEQAWPGAVIKEGPTVQGEEAQDARSAVDAWLSGLGLV